MSRKSNQLPAKNSKMDTSPLASLELFVVRNKEGKFFRRKGYGGSGESWVASIGAARIYPKLGGARAIVSFYALNYPQYGVPELVKMTVSEVEVIDETERLKKSQIAKAKKKERQELRRKEWALEQAKRELETAQARYNAVSKTKK